ncbi:MAG: VanZ family protein [Chitinophagales bacterium]
MNDATVLNRVITWLEKRRALNVALVAAYFIFIVFMHDPLVHVSVWVEAHLSLPVYNKATAIIYLLFVFGLCWTLWRQFPLYPENRRLKLFYLSVTLSLIIIHSRFMFESNIEVIHSFEFTILTFLIFPLWRRFGAAVLFTIPFMLVDEWYQYIFLYPDWNDYFDLNDVVMDTYGSALAMIVLFIAGVTADINRKPLYKRPEFSVLVFIAIVIGVLCLTGVVAPYMNERTPQTLLVLNERMSAEPFWRAHPTHNIMYHVMKPVEGLLAIGSLALFYFGLDALRK